MKEAGLLGSSQLRQVLRNVLLSKGHYSLISDLWLSWNDGAPLTLVVTLAQPARLLGIHFRACASITEIPLFVPLLVVGVGS